MDNKRSYDIYFEYFYSKSIDNNAKTIKKERDTINSDLQLIDPSIKIVGIQYLIKNEIKYILTKQSKRFNSQIKQLISEKYGNEKYIVSESNEEVPIGNSPICNKYEDTLIIIRKSNFTMPYIYILCIFILILMLLYILYIFFKIVIN